MRDGPAAGLALIDGILVRGQLDTYPLAHAARADLLRRLGHIAEARAAYQCALALEPAVEPLAPALGRRLRELGRPAGEDA